MLRAELSPWLAVLDLHAPRWRRCLQHGADGALQAIELYATPPPSREDQIQLREALELLAFVLRLDANHLVAAVAPNGSEAVRAGSEPHDGLSRLCLQFDIGNTESQDDDQDGGRCNLWCGFFGGWAFESASEAFKNTWQQCMRLAPRFGVADAPGMSSTRDSRLQVDFLIRLCGGSESQQGDLTSIVALIKSVDRQSFAISSMQVEAESPAFDHSQLSCFVQVLDSWRDESTIEFKLSLPGASEDVYSHTQWKTLFEVITLQEVDETPRDSLPCPWKLSVECASSPDETTEALAVICLQALAQTDQVSSLTLDKILQDATHGGRAARARWLANLMRFGAVKVVRWRDQTFCDADAVDSVFASEGLFDGSITCESTTYEVSTRPGIVGVKPSRLSCLEMKIDGVSSPRALVHRIPMLVGPSLERLSIKTPCLPWHAIEDILIACPRLTELTLGIVHLAALDATPVTVQASSGATTRITALQSLSLDISVAHGCVIPSLAPILRQYGAGLRKLCVRRWSPVVDVAQRADVFASTILTNCTRLTTLELSQIDVSFLVQRLCSDEGGLIFLESLMLDSVVWTLDDITLLIAALASKSHALTRSLRKLSITHRGEFPIDIVVSLFQMLETKRKLTHVTLIVPHLASQVESIQRMATAHHQRSKPLGTLSIRQKLAVLSALTAQNLPSEADVVARVFEFAAPTERRRVVIAFG